MMRAVAAVPDALDVILERRKHAPAASAGRARRPPRSSALFQGLSRESLHLRFHGMPALTPALVGRVLEPDWVERGALIGHARGGRGGAGRGRGDLRPAARPGQGRGLLCRCRRAPGSRDRDPPARATGRDRGARTASNASSPRCCPRTSRCSGSSPTPGSTSPAGWRRARSSSSSRSPRARPTGRASTSATTRRSSPRCAPFFEPDSVAVLGASPRAGLDRRRAVPQHRGRRLPRERRTR